MAKVRDDLTGSVLVSNGTFLHAGDEIPEGVTLGDHLIAAEAVSYTHLTLPTKA